MSSAPRFVCNRTLATRRLTIELRASILAGACRMPAAFLYSVVAAPTILLRGPSTPRAAVLRLQVAEVECFDEKSVGHSGKQLEKKLASVTGKKATPEEYIRGRLRTKDMMIRLKAKARKRADRRAEKAMRRSPLALAEGLGSLGRLKSVYGVTAATDFLAKSLSIVDNTLADASDALEGSTVTLTAEQEMTRLKETMKDPRVSFMVAGYAKKLFTPQQPMNTLAAVHTIQVRWRCHMKRNAFVMLQRTVRRVQSHWRGITTRRAIRRLMRAVRLWQTMFRMRRALQDSSKSARRASRPTLQEPRSTHLGPGASFTAVNRGLERLPPIPAAVYRALTCQGTRNAQGATSEYV